MKDPQRLVVTPRNFTSPLQYKAHCIRQSIVDVFNFSRTITLLPRVLFIVAVVRARSLFIQRTEGKCIFVVE